MVSPLFYFLTPNIRFANRLIKDCSFFTPVLPVVFEDAPAILPVLFFKASALARLIEGCAGDALVA